MTRRPKMAKLYPEFVVFAPKESATDEGNRMAALTKDELRQHMYDHFLSLTKNPVSYESLIYHACILAKFDDSVEHKQFVLDLMEDYLDRSSW